MNVTIAADQNFALQAAVLIRSLRATHRDTKTEILLLHPGLSEVTLAVLRELCGPWPLHDRSVDEERLRSARLPRRLPPTALFRLSIATLAPNHWTHALYLDADAVVCADLTDLWRMRNSIEIVAATRDAGTPFFGSPKGPPWRALGVPPQSAYFNSGVLLINLAGWAGDNVSERSLTILLSHDLPHADQCAINTVLLGKIVALDARWNVMSHVYLDHNHVAVDGGPEALDRVRTQPAVVHYCTSSLRRPWEAGCQHPERELWLSYRDDLRSSCSDVAWNALAPIRSGQRPPLRAVVQSLRKRIIPQCHQ